MNQKHVYEYLKDNPEASVEEIMKEYPETDEKTALYLQQTFLVKSGKINKEEATNKINPEKQKTDSKKQSILERISRFLVSVPEVDNKKLYEAFPEERRDSIRKAVNRYKQEIVPMIEYIIDNPEASNEDIVDAGIVNKCPYKLFRLADELKEVYQADQTDSKKPKNSSKIKKQDKQDISNKEEEENEDIPDLTELMGIDSEETNQVIKNQIKLIELQNEANQKLDTIIELLSNPSDIGTGNGNVMKAQILQLLTKLI